MRKLEAFVWLAVAAAAAAGCRDRAADTAADRPPPPASGGTAAAPDSGVTSTVRGSAHELVGHVIEANAEKPYIVVRTLCGNEPCTVSLAVASDGVAALRNLRPGEQVRLTCSGPSAPGAGSAPVGESQGAPPPAPGAEVLAACDTVVALAVMPRQQAPAAE